MKRKYLYYSKYKINGLECHEFDEIIIPVNHEWVREVYIYKEKYEVFIEFELKNKRNNKEGSELEKDCEVLIQKLLYRLYVKDVYMSKHSYRHITSSYPPRENIISGAITIVNITDFYGKGSVIEKELFNGFESINITNPAYKYLNVILEIEEKSYRFVALYQYLTEGKSIKQFIEWLEKEEILEKYNISIKKNPSKEYENCNPELDDLSYLRTIIAHYQTEKSDKWTKEYNEMIDKNICKIISIIKEYK